MELQRKQYGAAELSVRNIGGIQESSVDFRPGVTVLVGRNATNRTSLLQAVMAALGSRNVAIKGDADTAEVSLTLGDRTYTRTLERRSEGVVSSGEPFLDDPELADLFAFLIESNEARRAVATGGDLRELIMRPVDTDEIEAEIERLVAERESLRDELDRVEELKGELPGLEERRQQLQGKIEEKRAELEATEAELDAADADVEETRKEKSKLEDKLETLRSKRSELDDVRYELETERESLGALKDERRELEDERDDIPDQPAGEVDELDSEITRLREEKQGLESDLDELQRVIGFNEELLSDADSGVFEQLARGTDEAVTDQLLDDDEVTCWTCGSDVKRAEIQATLDQLRELSQSTVSEISELETEIDELQAEKREYEQAQQTRDRVERRFDEIARDIEETEATVETLQERRTELTDEVERIEAEVDELEEAEFGAVLDLHKEANQLEYELGRLETDLEQVETEIEEVESTINTQGGLEAQLEEVTDEIEALRTKVDRIEQDAVDEFNSHMDEVLELLEYANLERIWIERVEREVREGRRKVAKRTFELHVVRTAESGTAYEDTVDHLSESEREVTGLVFALAGYLAHEVYEAVPFILLDSLEAVDSERIAALVEYLVDYTGYLLVALLPGDAAHLPDSYERITEI